MLGVDIEEQLEGRALQADDRVRGHRHAPAVLLDPALPRGLALAEPNLRLGQFQGLAHRRTWRGRGLRSRRRATGVDDPIVDRIHKAAAAVRALAVEHRALGRIDGHRLVGRLGAPGIPPFAAFGDREGARQRTREEHAVLLAHPVTSIRQARGVGHGGVGRHRGRRQLAGADAGTHPLRTGSRGAGRSGVHRRRARRGGRRLGQLGMALRQLLDPVDRDREVEVLRIADGAQRRQADQHALLIEQASAAGAARDRRRGLQQQDLALIVAPDRRQQPRAHGQVQALGVADGEHALPDLQPAHVAQRHGWRAEVGRLELAHVALRIPHLQLGVDAGLVALDCHALGLGQHMAVGDQRIGRDDHTGAEGERQSVDVVGLHAPHAGRHLGVNLVGRQCRCFAGTDHQAGGHEGAPQSSLHHRLTD